MTDNEQGLTMSETIKATDLMNVQCDACKALHPLLQRLGHALACMDRLNNSLRPCPACGAKQCWVLRASTNPRPLEKD
jgi:hypothetical protein